ncbi:MAG: hypothetical protein QNJ46_36105 [Leptolyngbyaceae cyanobacterium MO_188.B28]|nr:hypothetical protein [Leptolyngbyaceae cyanobacterium MO_188.B28]
MFVDELTPIVKELAGQPVAFLGGLFSGLFRLNLSEDPVKTWLDQQAGESDSGASSSPSQNGKNSGPQTISIE